MDYCWLGNIGELENAIEHAFVTCCEKDDNLQRHLPINIFYTIVKGLLWILRIL